MEVTMTFYQLIRALILLICLSNSSGFCMEASKKSKKIIKKPEFREIEEEKEEEVNAHDLTSDEEDSENTDDETYNKRHLSHEREEKKNHKQHKKNEKKKRERWEKKQKEIEKTNRCLCFVPNRDAIQCKSCKKWHMIPFDLVEAFEKKPFECINNSWEPHMSTTCHEKEILVENEDIPQGTNDPQLN